MDFKNEEERNELFLQRVTSLFVLIPNLDQITMNYDGDSVFSFSRKGLEQLLRISFSDYENNYAQREKLLEEKKQESEVKKAIGEAIMHFPEGMMSQEYQQ